MTDFATSPAPGTIRIEHVLPAPPDVLWDYLTEDAKRGTWMAGGDMELFAGGRVELWFRHFELSPLEEPPPRYAADSDGVYQTGRITRIEPGHMVAFTWGEDSEVAFELEPREGGTALILTHRRLEGRGEMIRVATGWHTHVMLLDDILNGRETRPFWTNFALTTLEHEKRIGDPPLTIRLMRRFDAPAEHVFDAWLDPQRPAVWMLAHETEGVVRAALDPRPGGGFVFTHSRDGADVAYEGRYVKMERPARLVFTLGVAAFSSDVDRVTVELAPEPGGCELTLTHEVSPAWAEFLDRAEAGWVRLMARMEADLGA